MNADIRRMQEITGNFWNRMKSSGKDSRLSQTIIPGWTESGLPSAAAPDRISFDIYFEEGTYQELTAAFAISDKYGFQKSLADMNEKIAGYSRMWWKEQT